jgi:hypothetical protein
MSCTGCSTPHKSELQGDPLMGEHGLKQGPTPQPPPPPAGKVQAAVTPVPPYSFSSTPATLASTPVQPLPGGRALAIEGPGQPAPAVPAGKPVVQAVPRGSESTAANVIPAAAAHNWGPQPAPNSPADLQNRLNALGVRFHKTDNVPEGIRFTAIVPSRTDATSSRVYEATAPDQGAAIQAVLRQIENQR